LNVRITTHLSYEGDLKGLEEIVGDFCDALVKRGYSNDIEDESSNMKSFVIVKENVELSEISGDEFWHNEIDGAVFTAVPADIEEDDNDRQFSGNTDSED